MTMVMIWFVVVWFVVGTVVIPKASSFGRGHHSAYLNVGDAQAGDSADSGPRDARRLEG